MEWFDGGLATGCLPKTGGEAAALALLGKGIAQVQFIHVQRFSSRSVALRGFRDEVDILSGVWVERGWFGWWNRWLVWRWGKSG